MAIKTKKNVKSKKCFVAIHQYVDMEDPEDSECTVLGVFSTEAAAQKACNEAVDEYEREGVLDDGLHRHYFYAEESTFR